MKDTEQSITTISASVAALMAGIDRDSVSERAIEWAKHALLDSLAVAVAGSAEPLADKIMAIHPTGPEGASMAVAASGG